MLGLMCDVLYSSLSIHCRLPLTLIDDFLLKCAFFYVETMPKLGQGWV
jgi:hypothetical protein